MRPVRVNDLLVDRDSLAAVRLVEGDRRPVHLASFEAEWLDVTTLLAIGGALTDVGPVTARRLHVAEGRVESILVVWDDLPPVGPSVARLLAGPGGGVLPLEVALGLAVRVGDAEARWGHGLANVGGVFVGGPAGVVCVPHYEMGLAGRRHPLQHHLLSGSTDPDAQRAFSLAMFTTRVLTGQWPFTVADRMELWLGPPRAVDNDDGTATPLRARRPDAPAAIADVVDDIIGLPVGERPGFAALRRVLNDHVGRHLDVAFLDGLARSTGWPPEPRARAHEQLMMIPPASVPLLEGRPLAVADHDTLSACLQRVTRMDLT